MTFILALRWNSEQTRVESFQCAGLDRKKDLTEPFDLSRVEVLKRMQAGEVFQVLDKISCRWDVGPQLEVTQIKGQLLFNVENVNRSSNSKK